MGGNGPTLDFAPRLITASYMVSLMSIAPGPSFYGLGHGNGFTQDPRVSLSLLWSQGWSSPVHSFLPLPIDLRT